MGTRHLIQVYDKNENLKVSQYGQWDGYPDGQGASILEFLSPEENQKNLLNQLSKCRFLDEDKDKDFIQSYYDNRTERHKEWFDTYISRDIGSEILTNITESDDEEILLQEDELNDWIEGHYIINFAKGSFLSVFHGDEAEFNLNELPNTEDYINSLRSEDD